ncbi:MAG TPA: hypothetical protein PLU53_00330 [Bacteroidia bacterium]|nr:hypothetical protein [Bacteroidia bacterium]
MKNILFFSLGICLLFLTSCRRDPEIPVSPEASFQTDVQPILAGNCNMPSCHGGSGNEEMGSLVTYDDVMRTGDIQPFSAHQSKLYKLITKLSGEDKMPPGSSSQLPDKQIQTIYLWIEQGAKNN